ncbi:MAG: hypothetical protein J6K81_04075 [Rikenellaceae bacterium]|nr:hypothetical protein [Rikenellaceae bacterium]
MTDELITLNESLNDGTRIYLYREPRTGTWSAYGYSAYMLALSGEVGHIASFSERMQMPSVCIAERDVKEMILAEKNRIEYKDGYCIITAEVQLNDKDYRLWVQKLK